MIHNRKWLPAIAGNHSFKIFTPENLLWIPILPEQALG